MTHDPAAGGEQDPNPSEPEEKTSISRNDTLALRKIIHDLNGELFLIRGYADLAMHNLDNQDLARKNLQKMVDRSDTVAELLMDLRTLIPKKQ